MKNNTKKILTGTLAISLLAALGISGTLAFLTDSEQVTNHFSMGSLDITIDEPSWDDDGTPDKPGDPDNPDDPGTPGTPGDGENLVPGDSRDKDPTVYAVEGDSYMRMVMMVQDENGNTITDQNRLDLILATLRYAENDAIKEGKSYSLADISKYDTVNSEFTLDTEKSSAGVYFYNYNKVFKEGSEAMLFTDVIIPTDWNQTQLDTIGRYMIVLQAQAIQSATFADSKTAFEALDGEINAEPDASVDKNYGVVDGDSDAQFVLAGRIIK